MDISLECAGASAVGRRRNNEDAFLVDRELGLFVVADGMGGYEGGEIASAIVVDALHGFFRRNDVDADGTWPFGESRELGMLENLVDVGLRIAHREVVARKHGPLARMGSTAVVAVVRDRQLVVGNLGDSRLYRLRAGTLARLTRDHSWAEELAHADPSVARQFQNCLTRAVGMDTAPRCTLGRHVVESGDVYLLCSDGLWDALDDAITAQLLALAPFDACGQLVKAAYAAGSTDNITAVVVRAQSSPRIP